MICLMFVNTWVSHMIGDEHLYSSIYLMISTFSMKIMVLYIDQSMWQCDPKNEFLISNFIKTLGNLVFRLFSSVVIKLWSKFHQETVQNGPKWSKMVQNDQFMCKVRHMSYKIGNYRFFIWKTIRWTCINDHMWSLFH